MTIGTPASSLSKALATIAVSAMATTAFDASAVTVSKSFSQAAQLGIDVSVDCSNQGPWVTLGGGGVTIGDLTGTLRLQNNVKGTHRTDEVNLDYNVTLMPAETIPIPKQPPLGGAGGNPLIWVSFDGGANYTLLGRCKGNGGFSKKFVADLVLPTLVDVEVTGDCRNNPGPTIYLGGAMSLGGINAMLKFTNNLQGTHTSTVSQDVEVSVALLTPEEGITFPKQPPLGGAGGNPLIYFAFGGDQAFTNLGRCNDL